MESQPAPIIETPAPQASPLQPIMGQPMQLTCKFCGSIAGPDSNFCPVCGKQLKEPPIGLGKKIYIYAVSLALPPLGLIWTFKYFKSQDNNLRTVGNIAALLTVIGIIVTIWFSLGFISSIQQQLHQYQSLGL